MRRTPGANHRPTQLIPASVECLTAGSYERQRVDQSQSESLGRFELFECLTAGSRERERVEFRLGSGYRASSAADSPVSAVPSPFIRSTLFAPRRSIFTAETSPARRENPAASPVLIHRQVNLPTPKNKRKSAVQLLIPLAALRVPCFLCVGFPCLCGALSVYSLHASRSTPIRLHRRDDTRTQRKPRCVARLIHRSGESSETEK